jgi:hypothetical protein
LGYYFFGYNLSAAEIRTLVRGSVFPDPILAKAHHLAWHPDDYVNLPEESMVAKDSADLVPFLAHCDKTGFELGGRVIRRAAISFSIFNRLCFPSTICPAPRTNSWTRATASSDVRAPVW